MSYEEHQRHVAERRRQLQEDLKRELAGQTRIVFEPGCGHGHWLTAYAAAHPDAFCLGIDIIGDRIERADRKREQAELDNLRFMRAEAYETLEALPAETRFENVFLLFLDPWPKKRHWKNRLFCRRFLDEVGARSLEGARLHFRTDHSEYFKWALEVVENQTVWEIDKHSEWPFEQKTVFQSKSESHQSLVLVKSSENLVNKQQTKSPLN